MRLRDRVHVFVHRRSGSGQGTVVLTAMIAACALCGCASSDSVVGTFIVDPAHYSAYHCKDFGARLTYLVGREQQLRELMDKASEGAGGAVIGNLSYRAEYEDVLGEEKVLRRSAAEKNCQLPPPASPVSATGPVSPTPAVLPGATTSYRSDQTIH